MSKEEANKRNSVIIVFAEERSQYMKNKKMLNAAYFALFILILIIPLVTMNNAENCVSEIDNRKLANMPDLWTEGFTTDFESYLKDRIGGRNQMINAYAVLNDVIAGEMTHPTYTYGQDGYVFFRMNNNVTYGDFHKTFAEMVLKLQNYCEARGSYFYFIFEPEKASVYERYLPVGVNYDDSWVESMMEYMDELGINYVDNTDMLIEKSYTEQVFNVKYDAGHWNDLGCFYATNRLLNRIHQDIPEVNELSKDAFHITTKLQTTLPISKFKIYEEIPSFNLKTGWKDITNEYIDEVEVNPNFPHFHYYINSAEGAEELPKMLFFQGSYYNRGPQFLVSTTSEYIGVHNYQNVLNLDYYYNIFKPDVVILDAAEYVFLDGYFNLAKMKALDFNTGVFSRNESIDEQMKYLKKDATLFEVESSIELFQGNRVDKVVVGRKFSDTRYSYLIANEEVFDLSENSEGYLIASIPHGTLTEGDEVLLFIEEYDGKKIYVPLSVKNRENLAKDLFRSEGVECRDNNLYSLTTNTPNNRFDKVVLMLFEAETGKYIEPIHSVSTIGMVQNTYTHEQKSGEYTIYLKANSNLADEYIAFTVYLVEGEEYSYSFSVDKLEEKAVDLSKFMFYGNT